MHGSRECLVQSTTGRLLALHSCGFYCLQPSMMSFHWCATCCKTMQCTACSTNVNDVNGSMQKHSCGWKFLRCHITPFLVQLHRCHFPSVPRRKLSLWGCYKGSGESQHLIFLFFQFLQTIGTNGNICILDTVLYIYSISFEVCPLGLDKRP